MIITQMTIIICTQLSGVICRLKYQYDRVTYHIIYNFRMVTCLGKTAVLIAVSLLA